MFLIILSLAFKELVLLGSISLNLLIISLITSNTATLCLQFITTGQVHKNSVLNFIKTS